jgi:hypothetical protein
MRRLDRRHLIVTLALCAVVWLCRAELGLEAQTLAPDARLTGLTTTSPLRPHVEAIVRDPFAGAPEADGPPGLLTSPSASNAVSAGVRVPDIDTAGYAAPATQLVVRAAIVGPNPVAYVDDGSGMQIVRIGDVVGGRNVSAIDLQGILFADGTRLDLAPAPARESSSDRLRARPHARRQRMDGELRASPIAASPGVASTSPASPRGAAASPSPAPELLYPTPGPLRTADARGLAPGVNPTPDFFDPTPFAYPYPYAPPH